MLAPTPYPDIRTDSHSVQHVYVHVPFCPSICPYCDFHVLTRSSGMVEAYLAQLEREAAYLAAQTHYRTELDTVYVGGGTPSFLRDHELATVVDTIKRHLGWGKHENTLEINPGTVTPSRAMHWKALGFDRASVGVQSLDDATLRFLGRQHSAQQARTAVTTLLDAGFAVSGDLITAVARQPLEADIAGLSALGVGHISAYTLTIEPGTPFARQGVQVSEADEERGFGLSARLLTQAGFERYEVSNYARSGQRSQHNLGYWQNHFYLGLGPGAAGHYPAGQLGESAQRRSNPPLHQWLQHDYSALDALPALASATAAQQVNGRVTEHLTPHDTLTDALFMGLRTAQGVDLAAWSGRTGLDLRPLRAAAQRYEAQGLLLQQGDWLRATPAGWWHLNKILSELMAVGDDTDSD